MTSQERAEAKEEERRRRRVIMNGIRHTLPLFNESCTTHTHAPSSPDSIHKTKTASSGQPSTPSQP
jgi:hypothetical protein